MAAEKIEIPLIIGGREIRTGKTEQSVMPHDHQHVLAEYHNAGAEHVRQAIAAAAEARREWASWAWEDRAAVFLRAAELLATTWRADDQRRDDARPVEDGVSRPRSTRPRELIDFWRFNAALRAGAVSTSSRSAATRMWNQLEYRALEGFVYAVTPFNFTAIGGNLPTAPALMGNTVIWKPAASAMLSGYYTMQAARGGRHAAGRDQLRPRRRGRRSRTCCSTHRDLAGVHFTGSTAVFNSMWKTIGENIGRYRGYPRLVGETGGKDFIVAHASADPQALAVAIVRGGFEYQGQKCSAASRVYVPQSLWAEVRDRTVAMMKEIKIGDVARLPQLHGRGDRQEGVRQDQRLPRRREAEREGHRRAATANGDEGYFIEPTLVETADPGYRLLCEEIFGPVVTAHVYDDAKWAETLSIVDSTSPYALTGAVFARDRAAVRQAASALRNAAGNFYINDKPTGAVVGQQPFGGARGSGTNDKAGSKLNLVRWVSARTVKETFTPPREHKYPFMGEE